MVCRVLAGGTLTRARCARLTVPLPVVRDEEPASFLGPSGRPGPDRRIGAGPTNRRRAAWANRSHRRTPIGPLRSAAPHGSRGREARTGLRPGTCRETSTVPSHRLGALSSQSVLLNRATVREMRSTQAPATRPTSIPPGTCQPNQWIPLL